VAGRLSELSEDPNDRLRFRPLHGQLAGWRSSDLGNLRILYEVNDGIRVLDIIDIGPRGDIYKR
jgi:mRNA-degrading endonuclease RelE of RelBE toxin-antitoxin system